MVKGVKRNIIEINNTGSSCFERIVFYLSPDFSLGGKNAGALAEKELKRILNGSIGNKNTLRYKVKAKKRRRIFLCSLVAAVLVVAGFVIVRLLT